MLQGQGVEGRQKRYIHALAVAGLGAGMALAWPYTVDDAYIVGRFAQHMAAGCGYTMNCGQPPVDALTGPAWLLPGWAAATLGGSPILAAKVCGALCALAASGLAVARLLRRAAGRTSACWASLLLIVQPTYATWAVAGLETGAAALGLSLVAFGANLPTRGLALGLLPWLRPELVPAGLVALWMHPLRHRPWRALYWAAPLGMGILAFRWSVFGSWLPLALAAKPAQLDQGVAYLGKGVVLLTSGVGAVALWASRRSGRRDDRVGLWTLGLALLCVALAGGDWMPGFRLFAPLLPLYAALAGTGLGQLQLRTPRWAWLLLAGSVMLPLADFATRVPSLHEAAQCRDRVGRQLATALEHSTGTLALVDVGYIPFVARRPVLDLGGITDPRVAALAGGHLAKHVPARWLQTFGVEHLVLHSRTPARVGPDGQLRGLQGYPVEQRLARSPMVRRNFRVRASYRYAPHYYYIWLSRRAAPSASAAPASTAAGKSGRD